MRKFSIKAKSNQKNQTYRMLILGLTGGICSGKSLVSDFFKEKGVPVLDADNIARTLCVPPNPVWKKIISIFGNNIQNGSQEIDRKKLADIVFNNQKKLAKLESIIHPEVKKHILKELKKLKNEPVVVIDAPLLLEAHFDGLTDEIIIVACDENSQIKRAKKRDKLSVEEIKKRMQRQLPLEKKLKKATYIIKNNKTKKETRRQFEQIWQTIQQKIAKPKHLPQKKKKKKKKTQITQ